MRVCGPSKKRGFYRKRKNWIVWMALLSLSLSFSLSLSLARSLPFVYVCVWNNLKFCWHFNPISVVCLEKKPVKIRMTIFNFLVYYLNIAREKGDCQNKEFQMSSTVSRFSWVPQTLTFSYITFYLVICFCFPVPVDDLQKFLL